MLNDMNDEFELCHTVCADSELGCGQPLISSSRTVVRCFVPQRRTRCITFCFKAHCTPVGRLGWLIRNETLADSLKTLRIRSPYQSELVHKIGRQLFDQGQFGSDKQNNPVVGKDWFSHIRFCLWHGKLQIMFTAHCSTKRHASTGASHRQPFFQSRMRFLRFRGMSGLLEKDAFFRFDQSTIVG